jgi:integrase
MTIRKAQNLTAARRQARVLLGEVAKERDPLHERRKEATAVKERAAREKGKGTLKAIAEDYLARDGRRLRSIGFRRSIFERLVYPQLGSRQIHEITRADVTDLLDHVDEQRGPAMADYVLAVVRKLFNWHAKRTGTFNSPIVPGMRENRMKERARQRILNDDELRAVWKTAEASESPFGYLVQFLLLTAVRRNEAARMTRSEIQGTNWTVPAARVKSKPNQPKRDHLVPLSKAARKLLSQIPVIGVRDNGFFFSADGERPLGGFSKFKLAFDKHCGVTGWTLHDLRRTARSLMSRAEVPSDYAERCLGHVIGGVRGTYDRHEYLAEMARAYEALAAQIERIVGLRPNVTALRE